MKKEIINKMDFLVWLYVFCIFASEVMWVKSFPLFTIFGFELNASVAIFLMPLIYSINDVITEVYWRDRMRQIMKLWIFVMFLIIIVSAFFTWLPVTERFAPMSESYNTIFYTSIRMSFASLCAFSFANMLDIIIFSKLRDKMKDKWLWIRTNVSNIVSEWFDTFVFLFLAFYHFNESFEQNLMFILSIWLPYWFLKCIISLINTPFVYWWVKKLKEDIKTDL